MLGPGASPRRPWKTGLQQLGAEPGGGSSEPLCLPSPIMLLQPKEDFVDKEIQGGGVPADNCPLPTGQGRGKLVAYFMARERFSRDSLSRLRCESLGVGGHAGCPGPPPQESEGRGPRLTRGLELGAVPGEWNT